MKRITLFLALVIAFSCKNETNKESVEVEAPKLSYEILGNNLLLNSRLKNWDTDVKPSNWEINESLDLPEKHIVYRDSLNPLLKGDSDQLVYIKQKINVVPDTYYILNCELKSNVINNQHAGIIISTLAEEKILGESVCQLKDKEFFNHKVVFNSKNNNEVTLYVGYLMPGGGQIEIKDMSLHKVELNNRSFNSKIAQNYFEGLNLNFSNAESFDTSINSIIKHTSDLLLNAKTKDSLVEPNINQMLNNLDSDSKFKSYLTLDENEVTNSFALKLVESSIEVLDEFNIGTQRAELFKSNILRRTLIKYYNPFSEGWITLDPYYNAKLLQNNNLESINKNNIQKLELGGLSNDWNSLIEKYSETITIIKKEKLISFPF
ncbi:MAG: hypothetical protein R2816_01370 [Flavobacteriaceae bacterium]|nr:hypothetical protein [Flavobacteriaceae bacterium]